ncbi:MAG: hypothetical protein ACRDYC_12745, partial [Acidimicrobiales bacterium]
MATPPTPRTKGRLLLAGAAVVILCAACTSGKKAGSPSTTPAPPTSAAATAATWDWARSTAPALDLGGGSTSTLGAVVA